MSLKGTVMNLPEGWLVKLRLVVSLLSDLDCRSPSCLQLWPWSVVREAEARRSADERAEVPVDVR